MRELLSNLLVENAKSNSRTVVLSGDHGYALFDALRGECPDQFINVGVMEQGMIGFAAGLANTGFQPIVYGLAAFVPIRVLEQIKLDICYPKYPVILLGDGAGLVYSTLGSSHQCGEDVACLRALPNIQIYTPADARELQLCFDEARASKMPSYIRIGKSDRPKVEGGNPQTTEPYFTTGPAERTDVALVGMGSMTSLGHSVAMQFGIANLAVMRVKPFHQTIVGQLKGFERLIVVEEHNRLGGLASGISDVFMEQGVRPPLIHSIALKDQFADKCGSWQYALSEHGLADTQVFERVQSLLDLA